MSILWKSFGLAFSLYAGSAEAGGINLQWNGSGCPKFEGRAGKADDKNKILAKHDFSSSFSVKRGPGVGLTESRKNCTLVVSSQGAKEQFALEKVVIQGKAPAASSKQELRVDVSSQGQAQTKSITLEGQERRLADAKFTVEKSLAEGEQIWSSCDRGLILNIKQRIDGGEKEAVTASIETISYQLKTKPCSK